MFSYRKSLTIEEMETILSRRLSGKGQQLDNDSRAGRSHSSNLSLTPYSKQFAQRMNLIRQQRLDRLVERDKDVLASRHLGSTFHTPSADLSDVHASRRSFGSAKPASRSLSPSKFGEQRSRSRSRSEDTMRTSRSLSRISKDFNADLQYMKDTLAAKQQEESLLEVKKQYYKDLLKKKLQTNTNPTPWIPTGHSAKVEIAKDSFSEKKRAFRDKLLADKAMRRAPWPGRVGVESGREDEGGGESRGRDWGGACEHYRLSAAILLQCNIALGAPPQ
ncbi:hypothetical protein EON65_55565, partial [archaeon]